jgi:hypothetical protein
VRGYENSGSKAISSKRAARRGITQSGTGDSMKKRRTEGGDPLMSWEMTSRLLAEMVA